METIWCPWDEATENHPQAPWPAKEEMREEGDERHTSQFGRFLALPRNPGNETVTYKQRSVVRQHHLDRVWDVPGLDDEGEWCEEDVMGELVGPGLMRELDSTYLFIEVWSSIMPSIPLHPPDPDRGSTISNGQNPLPQLLQTPSGLAILEVQGTINMPSMAEEVAESPDVSNPATTVGRVVFPDHNPNDPTGSNSWMKRVHLYIGQNQRLTGEVKKLSNPLGVIRRKRSDHDAMETSSDGTTEELEIMEIIYYKLLFSTRPEPSLSLFTIWAIFVSIRNIYFHPLSKFPGPKSAAATPFPYLNNLVRGSMVDWAMDLHAKYGPVVRLTPDELSFIGPPAWQDIYTTRPQLPKVEKGVFQSYNGVPVLTAETVTKEHTRQRRILNPAFSERALREQEDILKHYTDLLVTKLKEQVQQTEKSTVTLDITRWYNYTTFDTIGDLLFNDPFHSLENSADHPWVTAVFRGTKYGVLLNSIQHLPPLDTVVDFLMPRSLKEAAGRHFKWTREKMTRRIQMKTARPDFMTYILDNNKGEEQMTRDEMDSNASLIILAGSETSALTCSSSTYFALKTPAVYERLKKEVRDAFTSADDITVRAAAKLPFLHAVINEALRLHPAGPVAVVRMVDRPGVVVDGYEVPVGTRVGIPPKTMFRSPTNFVEPDIFAPERWLPDADPKYDADRKNAHEPFMVGPRNCVGKT
ncbi:MAG: hypothetical protein Q9224_005255 [Gallowayella concinna]